MVHRLWFLILVLALRAAGAQAPSERILSLDIPDVPGLEAELAHSWYGAWWALPQTQPLRRRLAEAASRLEDATGLAWSRIPVHLRRVQVELGGRARLDLTLDVPAEPLLADMPQAARRWSEEWSRRSAARRAWERRQAELGDQAGTPPDIDQPVVPLQVVDGVMVLGRARHYAGLTEAPADGWSVRAEDDHLTFHSPAAPGAGEPGAVDPLPGAGTIRAAVDLAAWADGAGIPGLGEALRLGRAERVIGTWSIADGHSHEEAVIAGARLPLRPLDLGVLEAGVPATALALSAIGIDGPALARLAIAVGQRRADLAPMLAGLAPLLAGLDGTAWIAVLPGAPLPDVVVGVPATAAVDDWIAATFARQLDAGAPLRGDIVTIRLPSGLELSATRRRDGWVIATARTALAHLGNPGLAARLRTDQGIPATAVALGLQANQAILRALATAARLGQVALALGAVGDLPPEVPGWLALGHDDLRALLGEVAACAGTASAPTSVGWLEMVDGDLRLHGRDLSAGLAVFPGGLFLVVDGLPWLLTEWSAREHPLLVQRWRASRVWWNRQWVLVPYWSPPAASDWEQAQLATLALASPVPEDRAQALSHLGASEDAARRAWAHAEWRRVLDDSVPSLRRGVMDGISQAWWRGPDDVLLPMVLRGLRDAEPAVREGAVHALITRMQGRKSAPPPSPAMLEPLLALAAQEDAPTVLPGALVALSAYGDPRVVPLLLRHFGHADPQVRAAAAFAAELHAAAHGDERVVSALEGLLRDATPVPWSVSTSGTVAGAALAALAQVPAPRAIPLIVPLLERPEPPDHGFEDFPRPSLPGAALGVLLRFGHPPAIAAARARLAALPRFDHGARCGMMFALADCPLVEAEGILRENLDDPNPTVASLAVSGLAAHGHRHPLAASTIAALLPQLTAEDGHLRQRVLKIIEGQQLEPAQRAALAAALDRGWERFGEEAYPGHSKTQPKPTDANDF